MVEKYIKDGMVAVLYGEDNSFGVDNGFACVDKRLIEWLLNAIDAGILYHEETNDGICIYDISVNKFKDYARSCGYNDIHGITSYYTHRFNLNLSWIPQGSVFRICGNRDGDSEYVEFLDVNDYIQV